MLKTQTTQTDFISSESNKVHCPKCDCKGNVIVHELREWCGGFKSFLTMKVCSLCNGECVVDYVHALEYKAEIKAEVRKAAMNLEDGLPF